MSRKVVLYIATSIDGYIADEQGGIDWLHSQTEMSEPDNHYEDFFNRVDTVVLGRKTYDQIVNELAPGNYPYTSATSYILTHHVQPNTETLIFTDQPVVELVSQLKNKPGNDIWIVGGSSVVMPLVEANLIDEYQIALIPLILGKGIALFNQFEQPIALNTELVDSKNGIVYLKYSKK